MNLANIKLSKRSHKGKNSYHAFIDTKLKTQNSSMVLRDQDGGPPQWAGTRREAQGAASGMKS